MPRVLLRVRTRPVSRLRLHDGDLVSVPRPLPRMPAWQPSGEMLGAREIVGPPSISPCHEVGNGLLGAARLVPAMKAIAGDAEHNGGPHRRPRERATTGGCGNGWNRAFRSRRFQGVLELELEISGVTQAALRIFLEATPEDLAQGLRCLRWKLRPIGVARQDRCDRLGDGGAPKGWHRRASRTARSRMPRCPFACRPPGRAPAPGSCRRRCQESLRRSRAG